LPAAGELVSLYQLTAGGFVQEKKMAVMIKFFPLENKAEVGEIGIGFSRK